MPFEYYQGFLALGLLFLILEMVLPGFFMAPIGLAAFVAALTALITDSLNIQLTVFAIAAITISATLARWYRKKFAAKKQTGIGIEGQSGIIVQAFESPSKPGVVKVYGDTWLIAWNDLDAQTQDYVKTLPVGATVTIEKTIGNRVAVKKGEM